MKCPSCYYDLYDLSDHIDIHNAPLGTRYINLRCHNAKCLSRLFIWSHFRIEIPEHGPWICNRYNFSLNINNKVYCIGGDIFNNCSFIYLDGHRDHAIEMRFVPFPLDDNLPKEVYSFFNKVLGLAVFS